MKRIYLTTPIFYPNAQPHIGHAYTCVLTDFLSRYYKMKGFDVLFSTGVDEHGQKIAKTAAKKGISPQEHVDNMSEIFIDFMSKYDIDYSVFIRTTQSSHKEAVQHFWSVLEEKEYIYLSKYSGWYDVSDEAFVKEGEIDPKTIKEKQAFTYLGKEVTLLEEECYFFKLSAFTDKLLAFYAANNSVIYPHTRLNEVLGFLKQGLTDIAISRTTISWGIDVPTQRLNALAQCVNYMADLVSGTKKHVIYVWIDALVNYLTVLGYPEMNQDYWDSSVHVIGKDILKFHAIYWPAFLMGADINPPAKILSHGWWLIDNDKMSKSSGKVVDPIDLLENYTSDQMRWFFMRDMVFGEDANFSFDQLKSRCNELANVIGNLVQRSTTLLIKQYNGVICQQEDVLEAEKLFMLLDQSIADNKLHLYAQHVLNFAMRANQYFDAAAPWKNVDTSAQVLSNTMYIIKLLAIALSPILPQAAKKILQALSVELSVEHTNIDMIPEGIVVKQLPILFDRKI